MTQTHVAIVRDHSASMRPLRTAAFNDFNRNLHKIQETSSKIGQETTLTVIKCGIPSMVYGRSAAYETVLKAEPVRHVSPLASVYQYDTEGPGTPLLDSVGAAIQTLKALHTTKDSAFLVMVITDGFENASRLWNKSTLSGTIRDLQATDRWTFAFRVPHSSVVHMQSWGIHQGNIIPWDQTEESLEQSSIATETGIDNYFMMRSRGLTSTRTFYTDTSNLKPEVVAKNLKDVSKEVKIHWISEKHDNMKIQDFVEKVLKLTYRKGFAAYQLTKPEKVVQDYKTVIIRDRASGKVYSGRQARSLLGLDVAGNVKIVPQNHGQYEIFIQSMSVNRKIKKESFLLLWDKMAA